jgi:GTP-binding protein HflX
MQIKHAIGLEELKGVLEEVLREEKRYLSMTLPYAQAGQIQQVRKYGELLNEEYKEDGIAIEAYVPVEIYFALTKNR